MKASTVSNAGPLLTLSKLNLLHLLQACYGSVLVPQAVYAETVVQGLRLGYADAHVLSKHIAGSVSPPTNCASTLQSWSVVTTCGLARLYAHACWMRFWNPDEQR
jgi:hypothetical protein